MEEAIFSQWLLVVGHGRLTDSDANVLIPDDFCCSQNTVESLIEEVYPNIDMAQGGYLPHEFFSDHAILSARNSDVITLNDIILDLMPGDVIDAHSADSIMDDEESNQSGQLLYPAEYLNSITTSGLPLAHLRVKIGCPVMFAEELGSSQGTM